MALYFTLNKAMIVYAVNLHAVYMLHGLLAKRLRVRIDKVHKT